MSAAGRVSISLPTEAPALSAIASDEETCPLLSLPNELIAHILRFLGPEDLMAVERSSPKLSEVARDPCVIRATKFLPSYSVSTLEEYLDERRAAAISELDLNGFLAAGSLTLERSIYNCVNLKTLRCANTRLLRVSLMGLLRDRLRCLQRLEWSLLGTPSTEGNVNSFSWQPANDDSPPVIPKSLCDMYVEVCPRGSNKLFLCSLLRRSSGLRNLHLHEVTIWFEDGTTAYSVLQSYHDGTAGKFETFTFTDDRAAAADGAGRTPPVDISIPVLAPGSLLAVFRAGLSMSSSVVVRQNPKPTTNCVVLCRNMAHLVPEKFSTLLIVIKDDAFATLKAAARYHHHRNARALTLVSACVPRAAPACSSRARDAASFLSFFSGCYKLRELNLAEFHFDSDFDCCSILANAGLVALRALALPSCALCCRGSLEQLAGTGFRLDELDVRMVVASQPLPCASCNDPKTCTEEVFQGLHLLCPLRRLTLCSLTNVCDLRFLRGCVLRELRLLDLGSGSFEGEEAISSLTEVMQRLESLKLESSVRPLNLAFLVRGQVCAPRLRRLCITSKGIRPEESHRLLCTLSEVFPAAEVVHVHGWVSGVIPEPFSVTLRRFVPSDGSYGDWSTVAAYSADRSVLCATKNLVSIPKLHNCGPRRF